MKLLDIITYPHETLRGECVSVDFIGERERLLFQQMYFAMRHYKGIGLAAPQIGISVQMITADIGSGGVFLANPRIIKENGRDVFEEGCLSVPDAQVEIERSYEVIVAGLNEKGELMEIKAQGLMARVLQHEIDHLQGRLIIDYLPLFEFARFELKKQKMKN